MKNLFLFIMVMATALISVNAQSDSKAFQLGVKGGVNLSTIGGDDLDDADSRTSFNAGLFMEIPISERFSFQPELLYSGQGFDIKERNQDNIFDTADNIEYQLDYIQVPLMLKVYLIEGLSVEAGPQVGFKINEKIDFKTDGGVIDIDKDDSYVKNFDAGLAVGAAYKFNNGFFVNARYTHGLTTIFKDKTIFEGVDAKNKVFQFGVGFAF